MANLIESSTWETGVYQLETGDAVQGGSGGTANCQAQLLSNRSKKIYDTLVTRGVFITPGEEVFVGQPVVISATFEGTVADGDVVYYNIGNVRFEKALADGSATQRAVGIADVTNSKVMVSGLVDTARSDTPGDILYLSDTVAGAITTSDTGVPVGRYQYSGIIFMAPAASAAAGAASIAPGSITPDKFSEAYYTETEIDAKCGDWDTAYTQTRQWDGGATGLVAATGRTSLELTGTVSTHDHDGQYYTETEIDAKCGDWDTGYSERNQWDGGATGLNVGAALASLSLNSDTSAHCHDTQYFTKAQITSSCVNWDSAYSERRQWDGGATNLNATTARTNLGLTGTVTTHNHDGTYAGLNAYNTWTCPQQILTTYSPSGLYVCKNNASSDAGLHIQSLGGNGAAAYFETDSLIAVLADSATADAEVVKSIYNGNTLDGIALYGIGNCGLGVQGLSTTNYGVYGCSATNAGIVGETPSASYGVWGINTGSGAAVAGNTAYCNTSSKYLKHATPISITQCLKDTPLSVYQYYWEDSNYTGFNGFIGPLAEEFDATFNLNHDPNADDYMGLFTVDGVALGLGIENMNEIDKLKTIIQGLYSCIQKLEQ